MWFLDSEPHIPNPVDILGSKRFHSFIERLKDEYDYVVLDTPPLSAFIDAAVIGSIADGTLAPHAQSSPMFGSCFGFGGWRAPTASCQLGKRWRY